MNTPARVIDIIGLHAAKHETSIDRVLGGDLTSETVLARHEALRELSSIPKPSGKLPGVRELSRWLHMSAGQVSRIVG